MSSDFDTGIDLPMVTVGESPKAGGFSVCVWLTAGPAFIYSGPSREMANDIASDIRRALMDSFDIGYACGRGA